MKITRSSKASLKYCTVAKRAGLHAFMDEYTRAVNLFIDRFWTQTPTPAELTKDVIIVSDSWLSARARQCAAREAIGMIIGQKKVAENTEKEPIKPIHNGKRIILSSQCVTVEYGNNTFDFWIKLHSFGANTILLPVKSHRHIQKYAAWKMATSIIISHDYIQFSFEKETGPKKTEGENIGVDVGINTLLATSNGELIGMNAKTMIANIKRKKQGSRKQQRARRALSCYFHKQVKNLFMQHPNLRLVVVENLKGMKQGKKHNRNKTFRKTLSSWRYRQLLDIIQMRAQENRVSFRSVSPYHTSQTCPICSHAERDNRSGEEFLCLQCGYANNADVVGAKNILERFIGGQYGAAFQTHGDL